MRSMDENNNIINFDDADSIFIPSNMDGDRTDFTEQKVGFYRKVPDNCALVRINSFNGHISLVSGRDKNGNIVGGGFKIMPPFITKSILVPIIDRTIDYPVVKCLTNDGIEAKVDIALKVRITDPVLYIREGKYQLDQLKTKTMSLLTVFIKKNNFDKINAGKIELAKFDPEIVGERSGILQSTYADFEKRYGIHVDSVQLKSIKLPDNLQEIYNDQVEERQKRIAQKEKLAAQQEKAEMEAKIVGIGAKAEAQRIQTIEQARLDISAKILNMLENKQISREQIADILRAQMLKDSANTVNILGGNNGISNSVAAGIVAGNRASSNPVRNISVSNADRLVNDLKSYVALGLYSEDGLNSVINALNDSSLKASINSASNSKYEQIVNALLAKERGNEKILGKH